MGNRSLRRLIGDGSAVSPAIEPGLLLLPKQRSYILPEAHSIAGEVRSSESGVRREEIVCWRDRRCITGSQRYRGTGFRIPNTSDTHGSSRWLFKHRHSLVAVKLQQIIIFV